MTITARIVTVAVACSLWACTAAPPQPPAPDPEVADLADRAVSPIPADLDDAPLYVTRTVIPPTPAMLKAALGNDPDAMREAVTLEACHASSSCPAQFGSCTSWSSTSLCSEVCSGMCFCRPIRFCEGEPPTPKGIQTFNSFRVCFDAAQHACTEWQQTTSTFCGCGE